MSFGIGDDRLHVFWDAYIKHWRVQGREGSYGLALSRKQALRIACDANLSASYWPGPGKATLPHGQRPIVVHRAEPRHSVLFVITRVRGKATPQFVQEAAS